MSTLDILLRVLFWISVLCFATSLGIQFWRMLRPPKDTP